MTKLLNRLCGLLLFLTLPSTVSAGTPLRDTFSDTWAATDALGRSLPTAAECGPPRPDRFVGMFYFLWLGSHINGGPHDITRILAQHPDAMQNPNSPPWGPLHAMHHWGESLFGYYDTRDPYVLRKHAQMLADAGVDVIIFDVTNQFTYRDYYRALLEAFAAVRQAGGKTPQVAFLCPFWDPSKVAHELWRELYEPRFHPELWFQWDGKPLILADPDRLGSAQEQAQHNQPSLLAAGHTLGQTFLAKKPFSAVGGSFPTYHTTNATLTLTLYREGPEGERVLRRQISGIQDNEWLMLQAPTLLSTGRYYLEASLSQGTVGWWSHSDDLLPAGQAYAQGQPVASDRTLRIQHADPDVVRIRQAFTFRAPQPDYFRGQTKPDMWSWLEVYPQHAFTNVAGEREQMSVGVAQNAVSNRLGSMSEPGARGRSYHQGATATEPGAVARGLNLAEQFEHALRVDPKFIFITGWNEWIAGRYNEFSGIRHPVMFVDQFDHEHSRDIEPMKGGHGDSYYYQMVSFVRRFKGVRPAPPASVPRTIALSGDFAQWQAIAQEYRDDADDTARRDFAGYNNCARYTNNTGRNDFTVLKTAHNAEHIYFYARTHRAIALASDAACMRLLIDIDANPRTGWEGYDFSVAPALERVDAWSADSAWKTAGRVQCVVKENELHLAVPRQLLGAAASQSLRFHFKWTDNIPVTADILAFTTDGDAAPNGRFNYLYREQNAR